MAATTGDYEFDVAVSFAGEDREIVQGIVDKVKAAGITVFYDTDYRAEMWGEDLVEFLDQIYRVKARYTMMFISRFYAEKMWTNHERRSAIARAVEQRSSYILPVRLDSAPLGGLRPTVGYVDARQIGSDGIAELLLAKLAGSEVASPTRISRVPRTEVERQRLLSARPPAWECLYFAGQLLHERDRIESKYRDHEIRYASATRGGARNGNILGSFMTRTINDIVGLIAKLARLVNDEDARDWSFGKPGESGDPERLAHLAGRWNSVYEEILNWAARVRGANASPDFRDLAEMLAQYADAPVEQYRIFVDSFIAQAEEVPSILAEGREARVEATLANHIPDELKSSFGAEFDGLKTVAFKWVMGKDGQST
jgi:hypothetical protein